MESASRLQRYSAALSLLGVLSANDVARPDFLFCELICEADRSLLTLYRCLSFLREKDLLEVIENLSAVVESYRGQVVEQLGALRAFARALAVLGTHPIAACHLELAQAHLENVRIPERELMLIAYSCGERAKVLFDWSEVLKRAVGAEVASEARKNARILAGFLGFGFEEVQMPLRDIIEDLGKENDIPNPAFWTELSWADFARDCILQRHNADGTFDIGFHIGQKATLTADETVPYPLFETEQFKKRHFLRFCGVRLSNDRDNFEIRNGGVRLQNGDAEEENKTMSMDMEVLNQIGNYIVTGSSKNTLKEVAMCLGAGTPLLLEGPSGCGKSEFISALSQTISEYKIKRSKFAHSKRDVGPPHIVRVQMDGVSASSNSEIFTDLIGGIVPVEGTSGFQWRPGSIGSAIVNGCWLVLENVSTTNFTFPDPVIGNLARLRPGASLKTPNREEPLVTAPGFQLVVTCTVDGGSSAKTPNDRQLSSALEPPGGWGLWRRVCMKGLSVDETRIILQKRFPLISDFIEKVVLAVSTSIDYFQNQRKSRSVRIPSIRDAIKICNRLTKARLNSNRSELFLVGLMESIDVLCAWRPQSSNADKLLDMIGMAWEQTSSVTHRVFKERNVEITDEGDRLCVGRSILPKHEVGLGNSQKLALNQHTRRLIERTMRAVECGEHILLTGETGTGKTSCIQEVATLLGIQLSVINMSRQSDYEDLIGRYGPVKLANTLPSLAQRFHELFCGLASRARNERFLDELQSAATSFSSESHVRALKLMRGGRDAVLRNYRESSSALQDWTLFTTELEKCETLVFGAIQSHEVLDRRPKKRRKVQSAPEIVCHSQPEGSESRRRMEFEFGDGPLVKAMREGRWILLDELNLAPPEVLERLIAVLDDGKIVLPNEKSEIVRSSLGFMVFGAMNPPTDIGKKNLPSGLRSRLTEFYVGDMLSRDDLAEFVLKRMYGLDSVDGRGMGNSFKSLAACVADFYIACQELARAENFLDGCGKKVRFSLRTLSRMIDFAAGIRVYLSNGSGLEGDRRALYEGAVLAFVTLLPDVSARAVADVAFLKFYRDAGVLLEGSKRSRKSYKARLSPLADAMKLPRDARCVRIGGCWLERVSNFGADVSSCGDSQYIMTERLATVATKVCRAISIGAPKLPIILQGPTAAGKTALVQYLSRMTGRTLTRINNHEHTDISEYLGAYALTESGSLQFEEGPLVRAARTGGWILLDELNLAPPDVLESLNRLLDDNREIRIPETGEVVRAKPGFTIFATQNPAGLYGGRKELSRAFRGRFVEIEMGDLSDNDLETILEKKGEIPSSFAKSMIAVMRDLQQRRRSSRIFAGKMGYVNVRDLLRWASRKPTSRAELAVEGMFLLAERSRLEAERIIVKNALAKHVGVDISILSDEQLYSLNAFSFDSDVGRLLHRIVKLSADERIALTPSMRRMLVLMSRAVSRSEPVLLVGETGCGKTSACKIVSNALHLKLQTINCHRHTEASDFIGGYRPTRTSKEDTRETKLFEWVDGPLVEAMVGGSALLIDELNMADDAVIERFNSVLEVDPSLFVSERASIGSSSSKYMEERAAMEKMRSGAIRAKSTFQIFATMNPGGDYGKKELSPALRNRFTEIWVSPPQTIDDYTPVVENRLQLASYKGEKSDNEIIQLCQGLNEVKIAILNYISWALAESVQTTNGFKHKRFFLSVRDASTWAEFVHNAVSKHLLQPMIAFAHGSRLVFLDGTCGSGVHQNEIVSTMWTKILSLIPSSLRDAASAADFCKLRVRCVSETQQVGFGPFALEKIDTIDPKDVWKGSFSFDAPSSARNAARLARALSFGMRPILLEGSPGVGKSSLVEAMAHEIRASFVRINLSEHTEMSDLVGADVPGLERGTFVFKKGPLLKAMKTGQWILLDELNLASQSVLEGLNSVLDHRRTIYVPEIGEEVVAHRKFRLFGAQNPLREGSGRRGLPRSFLNRFTNVQVDPLKQDDVYFICRASYPHMAKGLLEETVNLFALCNEKLTHYGGKVDAPFNLRDVLRICDLITCFGTEDEFDVDTYYSAVFLEKLSDTGARNIVTQVFNGVFGRNLFHHISPAVRVYSKSVRIGKAILRRGLERPVRRALKIPRGRLKTLETLAFAASIGSPSIIRAVSPGVLANEAEELVEILSMICDRKLVVLDVKKGSDSSDLLGWYYPCDIAGDMRKSISLTLRLIDLAIAAILSTTRCRSDFVKPEVCAKLGKVRVELTLLGSSLDPSLYHGAQTTDVNYVLEIISSVLDLAESYRNHKEVSVLLDEAREAARVAKIAIGTANASQNNSFRWIQSELVKAIQRGEWVLIRNADQCPAGVLDRLNPMLERSGLPMQGGEGKAQACSKPVLLPEAPLDSDGNIAFVTPSPDFWLAMTVNEGRGKVRGAGISRALRNRSFEVCLVDEARTDDYLLDVLHLGVPQVPRGIGFILGLQREKLQEGRQCSMEELCQMTRLWREYVAHGNSAGSALEKAVTRYYEKRSLLFTQSWWSGCSYTLWKWAKCMEEVAIRTVVDPKSICLSSDFTVLQMLAELGPKLVEESGTMLTFLPAHSYTYLAINRAKTLYSLSSEYFSERTLYRACEAFILGATYTDVAQRLALLEQLSCKSLPPQASATIRSFLTSAADEVLRVLNSFSEYDWLEYYVDPIRAIDSDSVGTLRGVLSPTGFSDMRKAARLLRFSLRCHCPLLHFYNQVIYGNKDNTLSRSKEQQELGEVNQFDEDTKVLEAILYPLLHEFVRMRDAIQEACVTSSSWSLKREKKVIACYDALILAVERASEIHPSREDKIFILVSLRSVCQIAIPLFQALGLVQLLKRMTDVEKRVQEILGVFDDKKRAQCQGLPHPRTLKSIILEEKLNPLNVAHGATAAFKIDRKSRVDIVQAIVSSSNPLVDHNETVLRSIEEFVDTLALQLHGENDCLRLTGSEKLFGTVLQDHLIVDSYSLALRNCLQMTYVNTLHTLHETRHHISDTLELAYRSPFFHIDRLVPLQRQAWLYAETMRSADETYMKDVYRKAALRDMEIGFLKALSTYGFSLGENGINSSSQYSVGESGPMSYYSGNGMASFVMKAYQFDSKRSIDNSIFMRIATVLCAGKVLPSSDRETELRQILLLSFVEFLGDSESIVCAKGEIEIAQLLRKGDMEACLAEIRQWIESATLPDDQELSEALLLGFKAISEAVSARCKVGVGLGGAWAKLGILRLMAASRRFTRSDFCVDPSIVAQAEVQRLGHVACNGISEKAAYSLILEQRLGGSLGGTEIDSVLSLGNENALEQQIALEKQAIVYRPPDRPQFDALRAEVASFLRTSGSPKGIYTFLNELCTNTVWTDNDLSKMQRKEWVLQTSLRSFSLRLDRGGRLSHFRDLCGDVIQALEEIQFGIHTCFSDVSKSISAHDEDARTLLTQNLLTFPMSFMLTKGSGSTLTELVRLSDNDDVPSSVTFALMQSAVLHVLHVGSDGDDTWAALFAGFDVLVEQWRLREHAQSLENKAASDLYVQSNEKNRLLSFKTMLNVAEETDEKAAFANSFYSLEGSRFEQSIIDADDTIMGDPKSESHISINTTENGGRDEEASDLKRSVLRASDLFALHDKATQLLEKQKSRSCKNSTLDAEGNVFRETTLSNRMKAVADLASCAGSASVLATHTDSALAMISIASCQLSNMSVTGKLTDDNPQIIMSHFSKAEENKSYNFYIDPRPEQVAKSKLVLGEFVRAIERVQSEKLSGTEPHPVLERVEKAARLVIEAAQSHTPLGSLIFGIELVLRKADEWQQNFAAGEYMKMIREVRHLSSIALEWRRLEVQSWSTFLDGRFALFKKAAHKWFYYLYDILFKDYQGSESADLQSTLSHFVRSSPSGEFETRLSLLRSLSRQLVYYDQTDMANFINGLTCYYAQFQEDVLTIIAKKSEPIRRKMQEYCKLAKWNTEDMQGSSITKATSAHVRHDRRLEYNRLRAVSEKARRKLHTISRKMDEILRIPASEIIAEVQQRVGLFTMDAEVRELDQYKGIVRSKPRESADESLFIEPDDSHRVHTGALPRILTGSPRVQKIPSYKEMVSLLLNQCSTTGSSAVRTAASTVHDMRDLIVRRVKKLRSFQGVDIQTKRRAFAELFRALRNLGVSRSIDVVPEDHRKASFWLSTPSICEERNSMSAELDMLYFKSAAFIARLGEVSSGKVLNADINRREAASAVASCDHLFDMASLQRVKLREAVELTRRIYKIGAVMRELAPLHPTGTCQDLSLKTRKELLTCLTRGFTYFASVLEDLALACRHGSSAVVQGEQAFRKSQRRAGEHGFPKAYGENCAINAQRSLVILKKARGILRTANGVVITQHVTDKSDVITLSEVLHGEQMWDTFRKTHMALFQLYSEAENISPSCLASVTLRPLIHFCDGLRKQLDSVKDRNVRAGKDVKEMYSIRSIERKCEAMVSTILLGTQSVLRRENIRASELNNTSGVDIEQDVSNPSRVIRSAHSEILTIAEECRLPLLLKQLTEFRSVLRLHLDECIDVVGYDQMRGIAANFGDLVITYISSIAQNRLEESVAYHSCTLKLLRTLLSLFIGLCQEGYCRPNTEPESDNIETTSGKDGTGLGDVGDGDISSAKDITNEIESGEELDFDNQAAEPNRQEEKDEAVGEEGNEMDEEFDGNYEDLDDKIEEDRESQENMDQDSLDKGMTDDGVGSNEIDEALWDGEGTGRPNASLSPELEEVESAGKDPQSNLAAQNPNDKDEEAPSKEDASTRNIPESRNPEDTTKEKGVPPDPLPDDMQIGDAGNEDALDENAGSSGECMSADNDLQLRQSDSDVALSDSGGAEDEAGSENGQEKGQEIDAIGCGDDEMLGGEQPHDQDDESDLERNIDMAGTDPDIVNDEADTQENYRDDLPVEDEVVDDSEERTGKEGSDNNTKEPVNDKVVSELDDLSEGVNLEQRQSAGPRRTSGVDLRDDGKMEEARANASGKNEDDLQVGTTGGAMSSINKANDEDVTPNSQLGKEVQNTNEDASGIGASTNKGGDVTVRQRPQHGHTEENYDGTDRFGDPNPHRESTEKTLIDMWKHRLRILENVENDGAAAGGNDDRDAINNGAGDFVFSHKENGNDFNENEQFGLGAATESEHQALNDVDESQERDSLGNQGATTGKDYLEDKHVYQMKTMPLLADLDEERPGGRNATTENVAEEFQRNSDISADEKTLAEVLSIRETHPRAVESVPGYSNRRDVTGDEDLSAGEPYKVRAQVRQIIRDNMSGLKESELMNLWGKLSSLTSGGASSLCEQLRLVLEPTVKSGLCGNFRTGKRLSMRRVIEYVASGYRKDQIWLRRQRPEKRSYDVLVAIDDSESMLDSDAGPMALEALSLLTSALSKLEVGRVAISTFGATSQLVHSFDDALAISEEVGAKILSKFSFRQRETDVKQLLDFIGEQMCNVDNPGEAEVKIAFIVSDGRLGERRELHKHLNRLRSEGVIIAFLVVDRVSPEKKSIFEVKKVDYSSDRGKVVISPYMEKFPFEFYAVINDTSALPYILGDALRQWFEIANATK